MGYKGQIEKIDNEDGNRQYRVPSGKIYPSVTTILGNMMDQRALEEWKKRVGYEKARKIAKKSADRGEMMHLCVEHYMHAKKNGEEISFDEIAHRAKQEDSLWSVRGPELKEGAEFFRKFYSNGLLDKVEEPLYIEKELWSSRGGGYAGTVDLVARMTDGTVRIIDFKNSKKLKKEEHLKKFTLQLAAYFVALWDRHGIVADGGQNWIAAEGVEHVQTPTYTRSQLVDHFREFEDLANKYNSGKHS